MNPGHREVRVRIGRALILSLVALTLGAVPTEGQEVLRMTTARQVGDHEAVELEIRYGAGRLTVGAAEEGLLYRARLRYDAGEFRPLREYSRSDGTARVRLGLKNRNGEGLSVDWNDLGDLDLGELEDADGAEGSLEVGLSRQVPTTLDVEAGATESTFRLGGIPLRRVTVKTGASETEIHFDEPNPVPMERMEFKLGAASLEATGLGNAGAELLVVEGAVGEATLDFTGDWSRDAEARLKMGLGSITLRIPSDLGVRIHKRGLLSSFSGLGLEKAGDDSYRTPGWEQAEHHLDLSIDAAFGNVEVEVVE